MDKLSPYSGFFDLSLKLNKNAMKKTLEVARRLGYNVVAIDTRLEESAFETKKKKKGEQRENTDIVPEPADLDGILGEHAKDIKILHRLTVEFSNSLQAHKLMQSENFRKYAIVAVIPLTQSAFQYSCSNMDVDLISFNPGEQPQFRITRKMYKMASDRGIYFELMYAPAINDSTSRRNIISLSHVYHAVGRSQNIVVTSNAESPYELRGPYDVINLCLIFGMSEELAKSAISDSCRTLYIHSVGRRCGKAVVWVSKMPSSEEDYISESDDSTPMASSSSGVLPSCSSGIRNEGSLCNVKDNGVTSKDRTENLSTSEEEEQQPNVPRPGKKFKSEHSEVA